MNDSNVNGSDVLQALEWRYATKRFDASRKIPSDTWQILEQALRLSPSSFGLQPWKFVVVADPDIRKAIRTAAWNQSQVEEASHLVVFCSKQQVGEPDVDEFMAQIAATRGVSVDSLADYRKTIVGFVSSPAPGFSVPQWTARQTYIALGFFLSAAALQGIDACPMEGFDQDKVTEILGLGSQGYRAIVMAAAGYRDPSDRYAQAKKVRFPASKVIQVR